ncbi:MAG TPA: helix-turn-helix domain-containing protein [Abditibacteriaceae bacterium]|jgi:acetyl-CoA synthetase
MELYYTVEEAASVMKVSTETVRRWLRSGTVQGLKHGRDWRIPESALCTCGCDKCDENREHRVVHQNAPHQNATPQNAAHQHRTSQPDREAGDSPTTI